MSKESLRRRLTYTALSTTIFFTGCYTPDSNNQSPSSDLSPKSPEVIELLSRLKQRGMYVMELTGKPTADDLSTIRYSCGTYNYKLNAPDYRSFLIETPKTPNCIEKIIKDDINDPNLDK